MEGSEYHAAGRKETASRVEVSEKSITTSISRKPFYSSMIVSHGKISREKLKATGLYDALPSNGFFGAAIVCWLPSPECLNGDTDLSL